LELRNSQIDVTLLMLASLSHALLGCLRIATQ